MRKLNVANHLASEIKDDEKRVEEIKFDLIRKKRAYEELTAGMATPARKGRPPQAKRDVVHSQHAA